jgi:hypothetical protein
MASAYYTSRARLAAAEVMETAKDLLSDRVTVIADRRGEIVWQSDMALAEFGDLTGRDIETILPADRHVIERPSGGVTPMLQRVRCQLRSNAGATFAAVVDFRKVRSGLVATVEHARDAVEVSCNGE